MSQSQKPLSTTQKRYYRFLVACVERNHCLPSMLAVATHFKVNVNAVSCMFAALCKKGYLVKSPPESGARSKYRLGNVVVRVHLLPGNEAFL